MFLSEYVKNELLTLTSDHPYFEDNFQSKFKAGISPSDRNFEQTEE